MKLDVFKDNYLDNIYVGQKLAKYSWFGVGGKAEILYIPEEEISLEKFLKVKPSDCKVFTIGAGSNLLIRDNGIDGVTLITCKLKKISIDKAGIITANCGAFDAEVARFARDHNRTGLEFLIGIPGTIGGGIKMNSGAFGSEFKDVLIDVKAINHNGEYKIFTNEDLDMKYRKIELKDEWIFLSARFRTSVDSKKNIHEKMKKIIQSRKSAQPIGVKTGGSTFKNPNGNKAWKLIDEAGCRGLKNGDAMISEKHCNFIINLKNAKAHQIEELGQNVRQKVFENSGIQLNWEIERVGNR
jgi:UDP-N-acetylmuramate dehydrogenase